MKKNSFSPDALRQLEEKTVERKNKDTEKAQKRYVKEVVKTFKDAVKNGTIDSTGGDFSPPWPFDPARMPEIEKEITKLGWNVMHVSIPSYGYSITCGSETTSFTDILRVWPLK